MYTVNARGKKVKLKRRNVGSVEFQCPNCGRGYYRTLWEHIEPHSDDEEFGGFVAADPVSCKCGANLLIADDYEDVNVYWLNKREMQQRVFLKAKQKIRPRNGLYYDLVRVPHGHVPVTKVWLWKRFPLLVREFRGNNFFKCLECGSPSFFKVNSCQVCNARLNELPPADWCRANLRWVANSIKFERRDYFRNFLKQLEVLMLPLLALLGKAWYVRSERRHWRDGCRRLL